MGMQSVGLLSVFALTSRVQGEIMNSCRGYRNSMGSRSTCITAIMRRLTFMPSYGEYDSEVEIATGQVIQGELPRRAKALVNEWTAMHRDELQQNWDLARLGQPLNPIPPLQ